MPKMRCAWLSRHAPSPAQRRSLSAYDIHQISPVGRFWSAGDAVALAHNRCGGQPDLYVVVMPLTMLKSFLTLVDTRQTQVIRAVMDFDCNPPRWTGRWEQLYRVQLVRQEWTPPLSNTINP